MTEEAAEAAEAPLPEGCAFRMEVYEGGRIYLTLAEQMPVEEFAVVLHGIADAYAAGLMEQVE